MCRGIGHRLPGLAALLAFAAPALAAEGLAILHQPVHCVVAGKYPQLDACFEPPPRVARARVYFRGEGAPDWYYVEMKPEAPCFRGTLPRPKKSLKQLSYYVAVTDQDFAEARTEEYATEVVADEKSCSAGAVAPFVTTASVVVGGAAALPAGFVGAGVLAGVSTTAAVAGAAVVGAGAAGAAIAVERRGRDDDHDDAAAVSHDDDHHRSSSSSDDDDHHDDDHDDHHDAPRRVRRRQRAARGADPAPGGQRRRRRARRRRGGGARPGPGGERHPRGADLRGGAGRLALFLDRHAPRPGADVPGVVGAAPLPRTAGPVARVRGGRGRLRPGDARAGAGQAAVGQLRRRRSSAATPVGPGPALVWTSELALPDGRGQVVANGADVVFPGAGRSDLVLPARPGRNRVEAVLVEGGRPGTWRFTLASGAIRAGSLRVVAGEAVAVGPETVLFRLQGRPGERAVFSFDAE